MEIEISRKCVLFNSMKFQKHYGIVTVTNKCIAGFKGLSKHRVVTIVKKDCGEIVRINTFHFHLLSNISSKIFSLFLLFYIII